MERTYETDDEIEIDLWEILFALRAKLWVIILAMIIGSGAAVAYSKVILTPQYTSTSMVYILSKETTLTSLADLQIGSQLTKDYRVVATSRPVLQEVIDTLGLDIEYERLRKRLILDNPADTRVLSFSIEDPDPARAKAIVDTVAKVSATHIGDIMEMTPPKIIEDGIVSDVKSSPHTKKNAAIGGMAAAFFVCALVVLQVILNDTIRTEEDVEKYLQLSILAAVPEREEDRTSKTGKSRRHGFRASKNRRSENRKPGNQKAKEGGKRE